MGSILAAGDRFGDGSVVSRNAWLLKCIHWLLQVVLEGLSATLCVAAAPVGAIGRCDRSEERLPRSLRAERCAAVCILTCLRGCMGLTWQSSPSFMAQELT